MNTAVEIATILTPFVLMGSMTMTGWLAWMTKKTMDRMVRGESYVSDAEDREVVRIINRVIRDTAKEAARKLGLKFRGHERQGMTNPEGPAAISIKKATEDDIKGTIYLSKEAAEHSEKIARILGRKIAKELRKLGYKRIDLFAKYGQPMRQGPSRPGFATGQWSGPGGSGWECSEDVDLNMLEDNHF